MAERMRLQKFLSRAGVASRRRAERLMRDGRVRVNGTPATRPGTRVDPARDAVEVDGTAVRLPPPVWLALHKPPGYVSTRSDPHGRPTIYDLLPDEYAGLFHVGRLDQESEGLMLLTNQGDVANRLMHPRYEIERDYVVDVEGRVDEADSERLTAGIALEDGPARATRVRRLDPPAPDRTRLRLTLTEGRKREVRRMFDALGHPVRRLVRTRYGPIRLGPLAPRAWRRLMAETGVRRGTRRAPASGPVIVHRYVR